MNFVPKGAILFYSFDHIFWTSWSNFLRQKPKCSKISGLSYNAYTFTWERLGQVRLLYVSLIIDHILSMKFRSGAHTKRWNWEYRECATWTNQDGHKHQKKQYSIKFLHKQGIPLLNDLPVEVKEVRKLNSFIVGLDNLNIFTI